MCIFENVYSALLLNCCGEMRTCYNERVPNSAYFPLRGTKYIRVAAIQYIIIFALPLTLYAFNALRIRQREPAACSIARPSSLQVCADLHPIAQQPSRTSHPGLTIRSSSRNGISLTLSTISSSTSVASTGALDDSPHVGIFP